MTDKKEEFVGRAPDYKGDGVAVWVAEDKNGKPYLKVSVLGNKAIHCFKNEPKPVEKPADKLFK